MLLGRDKHRCLLAILELLGHGRLWVNRVVLTARPSLPVYPEQRTLSDRLGMSQRCHNGRRLLQSLVKGPVFRLSWFTSAAIVVVAGTVRAAGQLFR